MTVLNVKRATQGNAPNKANLLHKSIPAAAASQHETKKQLKYHFLIVRVNYYAIVFEILS